MTWRLEERDGKLALTDGADAIPVTARQVEKLKALNAGALQVELAVLVGRKDQGRLAAALKLPPGTTANVKAIHAALQGSPIVVDDAHEPSDANG